MILGKTQGLARFLLDKSKQIDFIEPRASLQRSDTQELRKRILGLTNTEAKELGIGKSTLHYLRRNAIGKSSFKVYPRVLARLARET